MRAGFFSVFAVLFSAVTASAGGIEGMITNVDPGHPLEIRDDSGQVIAIPDGQYDARLSNLSRSYALDSRVNGDKIKVTLPKGFPGGDLRRFFVRGVEMNQSFDMRGATRDWVTGHWDQQMQESCLYFDPGYCRNGCWARQWYLNSYDAYDRIFTWEFLRDAKVVAQFTGTVERGVVQSRHIPIGACLP